MKTTFGGFRISPYPEVKESGKGGIMKNATVIAVCNYKGGTAKTTSALYLAAVWQAQGRRVLIVDADQQESSAYFDSEARPPVDVRYLHAPRLGSTVRQRWGHRYDIIIIDSPPSEGRHSVITGAMAAADYVLIPVGATQLELEQLPKTVGAAVRADKPYGVLLNREPVNSTRVKEAADLIWNAGFNLLRPAIPRRAAIQDAYRAGVDHRTFGYDLIAQQIIEQIGA
jgi:chromosome partitioning protein